MLGFPWRSGAGMAVIVGLAGCGDAAPAPTVTPSPPVVSPLTVSLLGQSDRTFIVHGGQWKVCDHGTVENPAPTVARDVRVLVTYINHGTVVGRTTAADAGSNGGALGDIPAQDRRAFAICGHASEEPDQDQVTVVLGK